MTASGKVRYGTRCGLQGKTWLRTPERAAWRVWMPVRAPGSLLDGGLRNGNRDHSGRRYALEAIPQSLIYRPVPQWEILDKFYRTCGVPGWGARLVA